MALNACLRYAHEAGSPFPETRHSCRGCRFSADPELYDAGCTLKDGFVPRGTGAEGGTKCEFCKMESG